MTVKVIVFAVALAVALVFFGWSCYQRFRLVTHGKPDNRFDHVGQRVKNMFVYAFAQRRVVQRKFGLNHFVIFWTFMILLAANAEFLVNGLFPEIGFSKLPADVYHVLASLFDVISALALAAVVLALARRAFFPPPNIGGLSRDASVILLLIATLMVASFGLNATKVALGGTEAPVSAPIAGALAQGLKGSSPDTLNALGQVFWWIHALTLLAFLNYLPYSKHMHILTAIPNCFFKSLVKVNTQQRETFEKGNIFGVGQVDQFAWKSLFDSFSCTECGRCADICPATSTGKALHPKNLIHDIKVNILANAGPLARGERLNGNAVPLIGERGEGSVPEEVIWSCTTCGACMEVCPVFIEHVPKIVDMRRNLVEMKARFPESLLPVFESIELRNNPWGIAPTERAAWGKDIDPAPFEAGKTEYLFYVGCFGAFDARSRQVTLATAKTLTAAGVSWGVLGNGEPCCGDSLRRLGNEWVFDTLAQRNVALFKEKGVTKIVTQCPHCFSTLKNDYRQYGLEVEVLHHSDLINRLIQQGRLPLNNTVDVGKVVFHDSCYLGRYNGVFEAPRQAITAVTGQAPVEMEQRREKGFCCGAGGGRMWMEEVTGKHINLARAEEAMATGPDTICVSCPYCMTMFEDAMTDRFHDSKVKVLDVAEVVAQALPAKAPRAVEKELATV